MKYISKYKIFESIDYVINIIDEILMPLKDIGLNPKVEKSGKRIVVRLVNYADKKPVPWNKIEDEVLRLIDFSKSESFLFEKGLVKLNVTIDDGKGPVIPDRCYKNIFTDLSTMIEYINSPIRLKLLTIILTS